MRRPAVEVTGGEEGELALRPGWPSMFRGYLDDDERYRALLRRRLVHRRATSCAVTTTGYFWFVGRGDDVIKSAGHLDRALRGRERAAGASRGGRGRGDRQARSRRRADRQGLRRARAPATSRAASCGASCSRTPGAGWARRSRRARSSSPTRCRTRAAARSCAGCCGPASSGCRRATCRPWRSSRDDAHRSSATTACTCCRRCCASAASRSAAWSSTAPRRSAASCTSTSARRPSPSGAMQALDEDDAVLATYREHGHALVRGVPARAVMAEMFGKAAGCSRGRGGSMHLFDAARNFYGGNAIVAGGLPLAVGLALADKHGRPLARRGLLLRRGRDGRGRVPRVDEPRRAVAAARPVLLREQPLRDGHRARALGVRDRPRPEGGRLRDARLGGRRHGRAAPSRTPRGARRWRCAAASRASWSCRPTASAPTRCTTPTSTAARTRSSAGASATRSCLLRGRAARGALLDDAELERIEQEVAAEIDDAVAFAEAAELEPVEDLERFVYAEQEAPA